MKIIELPKSDFQKLQESFRPECRFILPNYPKTNLVLGGFIAPPTVLFTYEDEKIIDERWVE